MPHLATLTLLKPTPLETPRKRHPILHRPYAASLLLPNASSTARDHLANERTFLAWLRLAIYLSVVSVALIISFHLKNKPSDIEKRVALPLGLVFWTLAVGCLGAGVGQYVKGLDGFAGGRIVVQTGLITQMISGVIATVIVACCILFLATHTTRSDDNP